MKKLFYRALSLVLMLSMLIPLLSFSTVLAAETESELFVEDFSRFDSYSAGTKLTNSSAEEGVTYYYKVRAIASDSAANSAYSEVCYIKAK